MNNRFVSFALFCFIPRRQPGNKYLLGECMDPTSLKKLPYQCAPRYPKGKTRRSSVRVLSSWWGLWQGRNDS